MERTQQAVDNAELRGQTAEANSLHDVVRETTKLWRKQHLTYDQTKHVVAQVRHALQLRVPTARRDNLTAYRY